MNLQEVIFQFSLVFLGVAATALLLFVNIDTYFAAQATPMITYQYHPLNVAKSLTYLGTGLFGLTSMIYAYLVHRGD